MPRQPPWSPEGARASVIAAADHIERRLDEGWDPEDLGDQMNVLEELFMMWAATRSSDREFTRVLRDSAEAMEAEVRG